MLLTSSSPHRCQSRSSVLRVVPVLSLLLLISGCGLPTWTEIVGGKKQDVPIENPNPPQPVVTKPPAPPPQPMPPSSQEIIAKFQAKKPFELDDSSLSDLSTAEEGLDAIEDINLNGSKVTNGGLKHLTKLTNLKSLDVRNSPVDKDGASAIGALTSLEALKVDGGEMTDEAVQALNPLSELRSLEIRSVRLSPGGWSQLTNHKKLEKLLILQSNITDATMAIIGRIDSLKELWLNDVSITDRGMVELKGLDNLEWLNLAGTQVTSECFTTIAKGKGMRGLKTLGLEGTPLSQKGSLGVRALVQLETLGLGNFTTMRDEGFIPMVKPLKNLKSINLTNCKSITSQAFIAFAGNDNIENINCNGCDGIDDAGLKHLLKCKTLKVIDLSGTRVSLNAVQALRQALPDLEVRGYGPLGIPPNSTGAGN